MDLSLFFQILGSLFVLVGYYLNTKEHPRQHMAFIGGHICLLGFTSIESKWVLFGLSVFIIMMQVRISKRKYKFKKDIVRMKKIAVKTTSFYKEKSIYKERVCLKDQSK